MSRYLSWLANGALLVLSCFLVANTANAVFASWLAPTPDEVESAVAATPTSERSWTQRRVILDRNLFGALLAAKKPVTPPPPTTEELEATKLPLSLIGTAAVVADPMQSWAAVQDKEARRHLVLKQGDVVKNKATVERIERNRIVLREDGQLRELTLSDDPVAAPRAKKGRGRRAKSAARKRSRQRRVANVRPPAPVAPPPPKENPLAGAAQLFSQANLVPKFDEGQMVGVQVESVQPGSAFEAAGIRSGETITEFNGIPINSDARKQQALAELTLGDTLRVKVTGPDGPRDIEVQLNPTH